jgi:hypothetical protein
MIKFLQTFVGDRNPGVPRFSNPVGDFVHYRPKRGRLTNYRTAAFIDFLYNPSNIKDKKGVNLSEDAIPGYSDPLIRFASGKTNIISFTLDIDGESSRRFRGNPFPAVDATTDDSFTIEGELAFYEQFMFPTNPDDNGADGAPDRAVLTFGPRFPGVLCAVDDVDFDIVEFGRSLEPTKAKVHIVLKRLVFGTRFANTIWTADYPGAGKSIG